MKFENIYSSCFLALLVSPALSQTTTQPTTQGNCTVFNWEGDYFYTRYSNRSERISGAQTCPNRTNSTQSCAIVASGDLQVQWSTNLSTTLRDAYWNTKTGSESFLHNLIRSTVNSSFTRENPDFNNSVIGVISRTLPLEPGFSGYINFFPLLRCVVGTMAGCTGGLTDGLGIEACAPVVTVDRTGLRIIDGQAVIQNVLEANVTNFRDRFERQSRGESSIAGRGVQLGWALFLTTIGGVVGIALLSIVDVA